MAANASEGRLSVPRGLAVMLPWHRRAYGEGTPGTWTPRSGKAIIAAVLTGYALMTLINVVGGVWRFPPGLELAGPVLVVGVVLFQLAHSVQEPGRWPAHRRLLSLAVLALATYLPLWWFGVPWTSMGGFLAGAMLLMAPDRLRWPLYAVVGVSFPLVAAARGAVPPPAAVLLAGVTLQTGLVVYGVSALSGLVAEARVARVDMARMAVVQERLRVARDLHDLLGYHLSGLTIKSELAYRLLPYAADRARTELAEILAIARRALADVRVVANGYRDMSLQEEARTVVSMLSSAGIEVRSDISRIPLPARVDSVLAIVLREAVTNVLRHSKAELCLIELSAAAGVARLRVANDGVEEPPEAGRSGTGLANLDTRLSQVGGHLSVVLEGEWFELVAEAPVEPPHTAAAADEDGFAPRKRPPAWPLRRRGTTVPRQEPSARRVAMLFTLAVLGGYTVLTTANMLALRPRGLDLLGLVWCLIAALVLQVAHSVYRPKSWPRKVRVITLTVLGVTTALPYLMFGALWGSMAGFLAGSVLLVVTGWPRWLLYGGVGTAIGVLGATSGRPLAETAYLTISSLLTGLVIFAVSSLSELVSQIYEAREKLARMAVEQERLRLAGNLNDVLSRNLSEITMKSELAYRLLPEHEDRTRQQTEEVLALARRTLAEVRATASGYRDLSLAAEARTAAAALQAAGMEVTLDLHDEPQSGELEALLVVALRETIDNLVRCSRARRCVIASAVEPAADPSADPSAEPVGDGTRERVLRLRVIIDDVPASSSRSVSGDGGGLENLRARLSGIGGRLTAVARDGKFHLTADVPIR